VSDAGAIRFAEKLLSLLDEGLFTATYKFAVILGLLDLALEKVDRSGAPPEMFTTRQLADKVIELYWPHTLPFGQGNSADVLRQNAGPQAEIVRRIQEFRVQMAGAHAAGSLVQLRQRAGDAFERLRDQVEWKLIQMALPRLQVVGNVRDPFVYEIGWDASVGNGTVSAYQRGALDVFDNRIVLRPGVGSYLLELNGLLRPLIHRQWVMMVARINKLEEARLERFLFGTTRIGFDLVRPALRDFQNGSCFYCHRPMDRMTIDVDHFIPWSRYPEDGMANLVATHSGCNRAKSDFLAATHHVVRWAERMQQDEFTRLAIELGWHSAISDMRGVARGVYLRLPGDALLWVAGRDFSHPEAGVLQDALG
jgi:hypothetical protein